MSVKLIKNFPDVQEFTRNTVEWNRQFTEQNIILNGIYSYLYYPLHWTTLSIKFAFGGYEYYILDKVKYGVNNSCYLILNNNSMYESLIDSQTPVETLTLNFTNDFVNDVFHASFNNDKYLLEYPEIRDKAPVNFFQKLYRDDRFTLVLAGRLRAAVKNPGYTNRYFSDTMHKLLSHIFRTQLTESFRADTIPSKNRTTRYELYKRLSVAKDFIDSNFGEAVELETLAKASCLSPHHLLRKFRSAFGITPHKYLTEVRLQKAKELVETTDLPISQVCSDVGFESLSSFGVLFRKKFAYSPENYRFNFRKKSIFK